MEAVRGSLDGTVNVGVKSLTDNECKLHKLNSQLTLEEIIEELCVEHHVFYKKGEWGLWTENFEFEVKTKFITDMAALKRSNGKILILKASPSKFINDSLLGLSVDYTETLKSLAEASEDMNILPRIHTSGIYKKLYEILKTDSTTLTWINGLTCLYRLLNCEVIKRLPSWMLKHFLQYVEEAPKGADQRLVVFSLCILSILRKNGYFPTNVKIFNSLAYCLILHSESGIQEASLKLINFMVLYPYNLEDENLVHSYAVNPKIMNYICDCILVGQPNMMMRHQLYRYQTLVLREYWHKKLVRVLKNDPVMILLRKTIREQKKELSSNRDSGSGFLRSTSEVDGYVSDPLKPAPLISSPQSNRKSALCSMLKCNTFSQSESSLSISFQFDGPINYSQLAPLKDDIEAMNRQKTEKALGEVEVKDPELSAKATSELAVRCLLFMSKTYSEDFKLWVSEGINYKLAEKMAQVVYQVLEIGHTRPLNVYYQTYYPLVFFAYPYVFEEIFCACFKIFGRVAKEMRANIPGEESKVVKVIRDMLKGALNSGYCNGTRQVGYKLHREVTSVKGLKDNLNLISFADVLRKKRSDYANEIKNDLENKPLYLKHRSKCEPAISALIERQRKNFVIKGQHVFEFDVDSCTEKDTWLNKSQPVHLAVDKLCKQLLIGKCSSKYSNLSDCSQVHMDMAIPLNELRDISYGKTSRANFIARSKQMVTDKVENLMFSLELKNERYYHFIIPSSPHGKREPLRDLDYWVDGLKIVTGGTMQSNRKAKELKDFLDLEVRIHFLEAEGITLPIDQEPPPLPPLPPNFDFAIKDDPTRPPGIRKKNREYSNTPSRKT